MTVTRRSSRYGGVEGRKAHGATYTPAALADYLARKLVESACAGHLRSVEMIRVLDPAVGDGILLDRVLDVLERRTTARIVVHGFETDGAAAARARKALTVSFPRVHIEITEASFLECIGTAGKPRRGTYDFVIANPPYVRTQILGARVTQALARRFQLGGRVDLHHAFLLAMIDELSSNGHLGAIVSNRFLTTRGAHQLRSHLLRRLNIRRVWDLGDTKLFDAAVLPALLLGSAHGSGVRGEPVHFTSVYVTAETPTAAAASVVPILDKDGVFSLRDGRALHVRQGLLATPEDSPWRLSTEETETFLGTVRQNTWKRFRDLGAIRVGVKTTADTVFIRDDWDQLPANSVPELLRPLITHHVGCRYRAKKPTRRILYPHLERKVAADLGSYPRMARYLRRHRVALEARRYVREAGRKWYELWVPHDPDAWSLPKLVFRDISEQPVFWLDTDGCVVNGDCYWLAIKDSHHIDELWLALAVANSTLAEQFYDRTFNNKLYAGRRRFMTQYVEHFPIPDPKKPICTRIIALAHERFGAASQTHATALENEIDALVWQAFGFRAGTDPRTHSATG